MNGDLRDIHELTGAYVLDALPADEQLLFERHLDTCAACRREVAELRGVVVALGEAEARQPSPSLRDAVLSDVRRTGQHGPGELERTTSPTPPTSLDDFRSRWSRSVVPITAAAAALLLVLAMGTAVARLNARVGQLEAQSEQVQRVLASGELRSIALNGTGATQARVVVSEDSGEGLLIAQGLRPLAPDEVYELWLIDDSGAQPAGLFRPRDDGTVVQLIAGDVTRAALVGITVEPAGGSPEPTSDPILLGEV